MSKLASKLNLSQVGRVCVTVADTDRAIDFYVDTLGFEKVVDVPMSEAMRWVEVALPGTVTTIALAPPPQGQEAGGSHRDLPRHLKRRRRPRRAQGRRGGRRRAGHPLGWAGAADVLAARSRRKLADRRPALVLAA
jgi:catechol 2,3-dioxygenase-like lactoylglutathione lyase family enzyme